MLGVDVPFPAWVNRLAGAGAAVGDAAAAVLLQAQQLNERYKIREQSGAVWLKARSKAAELDAKYRVKERADRAVAHVQQRIDDSETVKKGLAKAKETAATLDARLGGLVGVNSIGRSALNMVNAFKERFQEGTPQDGTHVLDVPGLQSITAAAKAPTQAAMR